MVHNEATRPQAIDLTEQGQTDKEYQVFDGQMYNYGNITSFYPSRKKKPVTPKQSSRAALKKEHCWVCWKGQGHSVGG